MSLHPQEIDAIPEETRRVARAAFPKGNLYMKMRDEMGTLYEDTDFRGLFPSRGQPGLAPWRLALVTIMQYVEGLSDRQALDAVRARIDWKYALGLPLTDPGFDYSVLCEFRTRLVASQAENLLLEKLLTLFKARGWLRARGKQRTDSTHVLAAVRTLNRLELVGETLRAALNSLTFANPEWLLNYVSPDWFDRYTHRVEAYRMPRGDDKRQAYALTVGQDGWTLLQALAADTAPCWLQELPAVVALRQIWGQQYECATGALRWRQEAELPAARERYDSPYDVEARFGCKRTTGWTGYKVHLTETCDPEQPHLITAVETTPAVCTDHEVATAIHDQLASRALLPEQHLVDTGYVDAEWMLKSQQQHGITVVGPLLPDSSWQANAGQGYDSQHFQVHWKDQHAACPQGRRSKAWHRSTDAHGHPVIRVQFAARDCLACPVRAQCTRGQGGRQLTLRPREEQELLQAMRKQQVTPAWQMLYRVRAGIEGTLSQGIRAFNLRRTRYRGLAKTHIQHVITAVAMNVTRMVAWLNGIPHAQTRISRFATLEAIHCNRLGELIAPLTLPLSPAGRGNYSESICSESSCYAL